MTLTQVEAASCQGEADDQQDRGYRRRRLL